MKLTASPVKRLALEHGFAVAQPTSLRRAGKYPQEAAQAIDLLRATPHDVMVVAAYGLILPQEVLDIPPRGAINIHASLLPRWRGAAPIHRAIEAGDSETGITLMQMDAGLDTGAMIREARTPNHYDDTTATLHDRLARMGAELIVAALRDLERDGALPSTPQPEEGETYAEKIAKHEAALDWRRPAEELARQIRAFDPFPGAFGMLDNAAIKIWAAQAVDGAGEPGVIADVSAEGIVEGDAPGIE
jgi:methionyl-tRNA formyltransferase